MLVFHRITKHFDGYDRRFGPDAKPGGGIHGQEIHHALATELADGRKVIMAVTLYTDRFPLTVPGDWIGVPRDPSPSDLSIHLQCPRDEGSSCFWTGSFCEVIVTTSLVGAALGVAGYSRTFVPEWGDPDVPAEAFWAALETTFVRELRNPHNFPQPDEPPALRGARAVLDDIRSSMKDAGRLLHQAEAAFESEIAAYLSKR